MSATGTFRALRDPRYRVLWIGTVFSFMAVHMQLIARGWLAFSLTGNNKGLGVVYLGFGLPGLIVAPWGGVAADRLSKRRVLAGAQLALALSAAAIALAIALGVVQFWMLVASAVVQGTAFSFMGPARMALTGELVGRPLMSNAIVLQQLSMNSTRILGPSVAGALIGIAVVGVGGVYWTTTVLMLVSFAMSFRLPAAVPRATEDRPSPLAELRDGLAHVKDRPLLLVLLLTSFVVILTAFPYMAFLPALAEDVFKAGATGYGTMSTVSAIGALVAALAIASRADGSRAWRLQILGGLGFGLGVAGLGFAPSYAVGLVVVFLLGASTSVFQALNSSLAMAHSDFEYHGRVQSLLMLSFSGFGLAAAPLGVIADAIGLQKTLTGMGACAVVAVAGCALARRAVERRGAEGPDSVTSGPALAETPGIG